MQLLQEYIIHLLSERLLPINQKLYEDMLKWYKKEYKIWKAKKDVEHSKVKVKDSKEKINSFIKENELDKFENFIFDSIYDFFDSFDIDPYIERKEVKKYIHKEYSKKANNKFELILNISAEPESSVLNFDVIFKNKDDSERKSKIFEFDQFYFIMSEDIFKWLKEEAFHIDNEYEENYYNLRDYEEDLAEDLKIVENEKNEYYKQFSFEEDGKIFYVTGSLKVDKSTARKDLVNGAYITLGETAMVVINAEKIEERGHGWLEDTVEHELRHLMQYLDKETGKYSKIERGLPPKKLQKKYIDREGIPKNPENPGYPVGTPKSQENPGYPMEPEDSRIAHHLRDVEFQTNLGTAWFRMKKELGKIEDPKVRNLIFLNAINPSPDKAALVRDSIPYSPYYNTDRIRREVQHSLEDLKKFDNKKWQAYIKMLYQLYVKEFS
jgi:hypothetical protein